MTTRSMIVVLLVLAGFTAGMAVSLVFAVADIQHDINRLQNTFNAYSHLLPTEEPTQP